MFANVGPSKEHLSVLLKMSSKTVCDTPQVVPLIVGHCLEASPGGPYASSASVTLIKDGTLNILVDCGSPWEQQKLLNELKKQNIKPNKIKYLICTHGHIDHIGNLNLFPDAVIILDSNFGYKPGFYGKHAERPFVISNNVEVIYTPGHTANDLSVVIRNVEDKGTIVVTGDLFENEADLTDPQLWQQSSWNHVLQATSRSKILSMARYIIPGHGPMFEVPLDSQSVTENSI